jgi:hypothetical protein
VAQAKTEGIEYKPDGTIDLVIDGTLRHLRRPKLREYRHWAERLRDMAEAAQAEAVRLGELEAQLDDASTDEEREQVDAALKEALRQGQEYTTPWIAGVVAQLSGKELDNDVEEWPSWLALDRTIPAKVLAHWKKTPLAPGAAETN